MMICAFCQKLFPNLNGGWHVEKEMKGKASVSAGAVNADEAEEIPAKGNGKGKHKLEVV